MNLDLPEEVLEALGPERAALEAGYIPLLQRLYRVVLPEAVSEELSARPASPGSAPPHGRASLSAVDVAQVNLLVVLTYYD